MKCETTYNKMLCDEMRIKANRKTISTRLKLIYDDCKDLLPGMSLAEFSAFTDSAKAHIRNLGERAQMKVLQRKIPNVKKLPNNGFNSIKLHKNGNAISIKKSNENSNIPGVKSFDAIWDNKDENKIYLIVMKTIDLGKYSKSIGGGHQKNVETEILNLISLVNNKNIRFENKNVEFIFLIDGRSAKQLNDKCQTLVGNNSQNITVCSVDDL